MNILCYVCAFANHTQSIRCQFGNETPLAKQRQFILHSSWIFLMPIYPSVFLPRWSIQRKNNYNSRHSVFAVDGKMEYKSLIIFECRQSCCCLLLTLLRDVCTDRIVIISRSIRKYSKFIWKCTISRAESVSTDDENSICLRCIEYIFFLNQNNACIEKTCTCTCT